jgi:predicted AlkP superfamily pyrophosphatase or phosphodiesterase
MLHHQRYSRGRIQAVRSPPADRVVLVVLDGLQGDAINAFRLYHMARLGACGASTMEATTAC